MALWLCVDDVVRKLQAAKLTLFMTSKSRQLHFVLLPSTQKTSPRGPVDLQHIESIETLEYPHNRLTNEWRSGTIEILLSRWR